MNFAFFSLLPLVILIIVFVVVFRTIKPSTKSSPIQLNRRTHYSFLLFYIVILLIAAVVAESMEPKNSVHLDLETVTQDSDLDIYNAITTSKEIDSSRILVERTHNIGAELIIENPSEGPQILIKRKEVDDGLIEETIYSPTFFVNNYDFTRFIDMIKPTWTNSRLTFVDKPFPVVEHVSYSDSTLLNQFSTNDYDDFMSYGSSSTSAIVYLFVPKNLVIETRYDELVEYID